MALVDQQSPALGWTGMMPPPVAASVPANTTSPLPTTTPLGAAPHGQASSAAPAKAPRPDNDQTPSAHGPALLTPHSRSRDPHHTPPAAVMPKGLRSFDQHDADFFLMLLPGARDRAGLPESVRFWKVHLDAADPEEAFAVCLIYGPSGCGKSSLVKAGIVPRLAPRTVPIYLEATPETTECGLDSGKNSTFCF